MFWSKIHRLKEHVIVAICDEELLGKKIPSEDIDFHVSKDFYGGEMIDEEKAIELIESSTNGNFIGKKITNLTIKKKYISEKNIILIGDIPHAQFVQ